MARVDCTFVILIFNFAKKILWDEKEIQIYFHSRNSVQHFATDDPVRSGLESEHKDLLSWGLFFLIISFNSDWATTTFKNKTNSRAWVRQRTIPTERPPLVGEVSANFSG
jgi:hypothetical protein